MKKLFASLTLITALVIYACGGGSSAGAGTGTSTASAPPSGPAYYVSPNGNDANSGTKSSTPFATLEQARSAMRGSSIKTTYVMAGTYTMKTALILDGTDKGESWLAYPGQTPVLDGNKTVNVAIQVGGDEITIRWLTIQNFTQCGIKGSNVSGLYIDSNTIKDITSTAWGQASVELGGSIKKGKITHNLIERAGYSGMEINAVAGDDISNLLIDMNVIHDACLTVADCGGIYVMDRSHASTGVTITNNVVGNYGNSTNQGVGIYLDDQLSNVTVKSNIVYGTGSWAFQIHGGDHNTFSSNIFDISKVPSLGLYDDISTSTDKTLTNFGMAGNTFQCNIIYSSSTPPAELWTYGNEGLALKGMVIAKPVVSSNIYWGTNGSLPNTGAIVDSSPAVTNPQLVDPAKADYRFKSGPPTSCAFLPSDLTNVGPLTP